MWKWIDMVMRTQQQPQSDPLETTFELSLGDGSLLCPPLRILKNVLESKYRDVMVAGAGERPK